VRFELPDRAALGGDPEIKEKDSMVNIDLQYEINIR
jgi:hypothetical protein